MAKNKGKKIILFLMEGVSDCTSLEFIDKLNKNEMVKFYPTRGDITTKNGINSQNCIKEVNEHLKMFLATNKFCKSDVIKIIHVLDTDGAYIPNEKIFEDENAVRFIYTTTGIIAPSKQAVTQRNENKKEVLEKLLSTPKINSIPYELYYMSCNLEHVLHNKLELLSDEEKKELANLFADSFYEREDEFLEFINSKSFKVEGNYKETWHFIKQDLNSVNRYSNLWLVFNK